MADPPVLCPLVTPFDDDAVDADALAALVERLRSIGLDGFVPCGTTGEFASLTVEERRTVIETTVEAAGDATVLAGVADTTVDGVRSGIAHADAVGADGALTTLPYFHGANDPEGELRFLREATADAGLPVYLYNIPPYVGREIPPDVISRAAEIDAVQGLKDTSDDLSYLRRVDRRTPDDFPIYQGIDSLYLPSVLVGATGGIHAVSNALPEAFVALRDAVADGDLDRARTVATAAIEPVFEACAEYGFAPATKVAAAERGFVEDASVRAPLVELDADERADVEAAVRSALEAV